MALSQDGAQWLRCRPEVRERETASAGSEREPRIIVVKLLRACGGCLGTRRRKGVEDCEKSGEVVKRALIPEFPSKPRELTHLSTWWKRKKPRFPQ